MKLRDDEDRSIYASVQRLGQEHIFRWWDELDDAERNALAAQIKSIDFDLLARLISSLAHEERSPEKRGRIEPAEVIRVPETDDEKQYERRAKERGERLLSEGKVCAFLVAGGQGARMGCAGPKGIVPIGLISGKSLFQLHAERILAVSRRYGAVMPWYIMTSETNDEQTKQFFEDNEYFGLSPDDVQFAIQDMLPAVDFASKIMMDSKSRIFMSPTGHGASFSTLYDRGATADMKSRGVEYIYHFQVDNAVVKIGDPVFLGYHDLKGAEMSCKMVRKSLPAERVGLAVVKDGKHVIIEYSDLDDQTANERAPDGRLRFWAGNIAQHVYNVSFVERMRPIGRTMSFHRARKKVPYVNERGERVTPDKENGVKFESFVFDFLPYATEVMHMEIVREKEYTPVKTPDGPESPPAAQRTMVNLYAEWLESAGVKVPRDNSGEVTARIEISSLYALDQDELARKVDKNLVVGEELYLSEG